jgi:predicted O-methyltransferase YrrM
VAVEAALERIEGVEGWLSEAQARRLHRAAEGLAAGGRIVEIGSYRGRSAIVFAHAAGDGVEVVAIDPHAGNDRGPQQIEGTAAEGNADHDAFRANLERAGATGRVRHVRLPSQAALGEVDGAVDVLYVDGAHRYGPASADVVRWGERVKPGGTMLIHDSFSSIGVTLAILRHLVPSGRFAYVGRTASLAEYRRTDPRGRARLVSAARQLAQLPWFARNVLVKVALVLRLRPVARALGHASGDWPY